MTRLQRWLAVGIVGAVVAALLARTTRHSLHQSGRLRRTSEVARVGLRASVRTATTEAKKVFADAERRSELDHSREMHTAEDVVKALGNMKGAMMKLGQMASYIDDGVPEPMRTALASLQADAPPMSAGLAAQVIRNELGGDPESIFATWDATPIAAASIGQVHRAITKDGQAVAVKVQYPGIDAAIAADLGNADMIARALSMVYPGLEHGPFVDELRLRLIEELDYNQEADNQRLFAEYYRDHPTISIPDVVDDSSTARVLTSTLSPGARFSEAELWSQERRNDAGETIFRFVFRSLYRLAAFNADPHPGNYLFEADGRVTFLDFGLVKRFTSSDVAVFESLIKNIVLNPDPALFRATVEDAGVLSLNAPFDDETIAGWFRQFYAFLLKDETVRLTPEYANASVRSTFDRQANDLLRYTNIPPSFVLLQRIQVGLYGVLGRLSPELNFRRIAEELWPFVDGPPSTAIGEAEAKWHALRHGNDRGLRTWTNT